MANVPRHVRLAQKSALFKQLLDSEDGKQLLAELKRFCCLEEPTIMTSPATRVIDPYATIYNEGKRVVLLHMLRLAGLSYHDIERVRSIDERETAKDIENEVYNG